MLLTLILGCSLPSPEGRGSFVTRCVGCLEDERPDGAVFLLRLASGGAPARAEDGERWSGTRHEELGRALLQVGDLDGDGLSDVSTHSAILRSADAPGDRYVAIGELTPVGDIDGDGLDEHLVTDDTVLPGSALADGVVADVWSVAPSGYSGGPGPDIDQDGLADTIWRDSLADDRTQLKAVPGSTVAGSVVLAESVAEWVTDSRVIGSWDAGDIDGDGVDDLALAVADADGTGHLYLYSGGALAGGQFDEIARIEAKPGEPTDAVAYSVVALGDVDGDGLGDLAVARYTSGGEAIGWRVAGKELDSPWFAFHGKAIPGFGEGVTLSGRDLDGDGLSELLVADSESGVGSVTLGADLAADAPAPTWSWTGGASAALAGLDDEGRLVVWVGTDSR